jgi:hypothetical protein
MTDDKDNGGYGDRGYDGDYKSRPVATGRHPCLNEKPSRRRRCIR